MKEQYTSAIIRKNNTALNNVSSSMDIVALTNAEASITMKENVATLRELNSMYIASLTGKIGLVASSAEENIQYEKIFTGRNYDVDGQTNLKLFSEYEVPFFYMQKAKGTLNFKIEFDLDLQGGGNSSNLTLKGNMNGLNPDWIRQVATVYPGVQKIVINTTYSLSEASDPNILKLKELYLNFGNDITNAKISNLRVSIGFKTNGLSYT